MSEIKAKRPDYVIIGEDHFSDEAFYLVNYLLKYCDSASLCMEGFEAGKIDPGSAKIRPRLIALTHPEKWYKLVKVAEAAGVAAHGIDAEPKKRVSDAELHSYRTKKWAEYLTSDKVKKPALVLVGAGHVGDNMEQLGNKSNIVHRLKQQKVGKENILAIGGYFFPYDWQPTILLDIGVKTQLVDEGSLLKLEGGLDSSERFKRWLHNYTSSDYVLFYGHPLKTLLRPKFIDASGTYSVSLVHNREGSAIKVQFKA